MTTLPALPTTPGQIANALAAASVFSRYADVKADATLRQQERSLAAFARYLMPRGVRVEARELASNGNAWQGITHGLIEGFRLWTMGEGYAIGSINVMLSHIRVYAGLAFQSGHLSVDEHQRIQAIPGIKGGAAANIDKRRDVKRRGYKKAVFNAPTREELDALLDQPPTPRGRRNAAMIAMLAYLGFRAGELALITRDDINLDAARIHVYRPKWEGTDKAHMLYRLDNPPRLLDALMAYLQLDAPAEGLLLRGSRQNSDELSGHPMTRTTISQEVAREGKRIGISNLSAHDLRHGGATRLGAKGDMVKLMSWGGWKSASTAMRYIKGQEIANADIEWE